MKTIKIHDKEFIPYITEEEIEHRVTNIAREIEIHYGNKRPLIIGILNGCFIFASDIFKKLNIEVEISFIKLLSYKGTSSTGNVISSVGLEEKVNGRHIIIIEDIIDTGATLNAFLPQIQSQQPASLSIATFLLKPEALIYDIKPDWVGFEIENKFVVGYGLDYDGLGRNLKEIFQLK
jgi:hypoxanthine phosphoribosyltransferase